MSPADLAQAFLDGATLPGVEFLHNEPVRVARGRHIGTVGCIVTVLALTPEPRFLIESATGNDIEVLQSELARAA